MAPPVICSYLSSTPAPHKHLLWDSCRSMEGGGEKRGGEKRGGEKRGGDEEKQKEDGSEVDGSVELSILSPDEMFQLVSSNFPSSVNLQCFRLRLLNLLQDR